MFTFVQRRDDVCSFTVIIILFSNSVKWQDFTFNSADDITKQMYAVDVCAIAKISLPSAVHWAMKFQFWSQICLRPLKLTTFVCWPSTNASRTRSLHYQQPQPAAAAERERERECVCVCVLSWWSMCCRLFLRCAICTRTKLSYTVTWRLTTSCSTKMTKWPSVSTVLVAVQLKRCNLIGETALGWPATKSLYGLAPPQPTSSSNVVKGWSDVSS